VAEERRRAVAVVDGGLHLRVASRRALGEDALAVLAVVVAVVLEQLVAVGAVVPAAVVEGLGLGARRAALRLPQLGRDDHAAVRAREHVVIASSRNWNARSIDDPARIACRSQRSRRG